MAYGLVPLSQMSHLFYYMVVNNEKDGGKGEKGDEITPTPTTWKTSETSETSETKSIAIGMSQMVQNKSRSETSETRPVVC